MPDFRPGATRSAFSLSETYFAVNGRTLRASLPDCFGRLSLSILIQVYLMRGSINVPVQYNTGNDNASQSEALSLPVLASVQGFYSGPHLWLMYS